MSKPKPTLTKDFEPLLEELIGRASQHRNPQDILRAFSETARIELERVSVDTEGYINRCRERLSRLSDIDSQR